MAQNYKKYRHSGLLCLAGKHWPAHKNFFKEVQYPSDAANGKSNDVEL